MGDHVGLCNVTRYTDPQYTEHVPAPLLDAAVNITDATNTFLADGSRDIYSGVNKSAILNLRDHIGHLRAGVVNVAAENPAPTNPLALSGEDAVACRQQLVDAFLAEGMAEVNDGKTYSGYPLYGRKSAAERLDAVRRILHETLQVDLQLPRAGATPETMESREQYWRRLARLYIQKGQDIATHTAAILGTAPFEPEDPFYMIDLGRVVEQMALWRHCLPMVRPHFAVKCNPTLPIMQVLAALGAGFDCASKAEISLVLDNHLVDSPNDIIFANPCKQPGDIKAASAAGVLYTTFDNEEELKKLATYMPNARAVLRIATNDSSAKCAFSTKFGARLNKVPALLALAAALHVDIYGVSFHVGSGNNDPGAYVSAIEAAHDVFEEAARHGFNCTLLDIGGGYPGTRRLSSASDRTASGDGEDDCGGLAFEAIAAAIRPVLERLFPNTTIISEPGRYFTAATHAVAMNVFAKRTLRLSEPERAQFFAQHAVVASRLEAEEEDAANGVICGLNDEGQDHTTMANGSMVAGADYDDDEAAALPTEDERRRRQAAHGAVSWEEHQYYVNDGLYHSFNCIVFDHAHPRLWLLDDGDGADRATAAAAPVDPAENVVTAEELAAQASAAAQNHKPSRIVVTTTTMSSDSDSQTHGEDGENEAIAEANADHTAADATDAPLPHTATAADTLDDETSAGSLQQSFAADSFAVRTTQWARHADAEAVTRRRACAPRPLRVSTVFGPTCDSLDCILKQQPFPEMHVGDWLLAPDMGSYTTAAGCPFNGFATRRRELVCSVKLL